MTQSGLIFYLWRLLLSCFNKNIRNVIFSTKHQSLQKLLILELFVDEWRHWNFANFLLFFVDNKSKCFHFVKHVLHVDMDFFSILQDKCFLKLENFKGFFWKFLWNVVKKGDLVWISWLLLIYKQDWYLYAPVYFFALVGIVLLLLS